MTTSGQGQKIITGRKLSQGNNSVALIWHLGHLKKKSEHPMWQYNATYKICKMYNQHLCKQLAKCPLVVTSDHNYNPHSSNLTAWNKICVAESTKYVVCRGTDSHWGNLYKKRGPSVCVSVRTENSYPRIWWRPRLCP